LSPDAASTAFSASSLAAGGRYASSAVMSAVEEPPATSAASAPSRATSRLSGAVTHSSPAVG
jgi:hypothetical protein